MEESTSKSLDVEKLDELFGSVDWKKRGPEKWREILSKSGFVYSLWDSDLAIGIGRTLEDGEMCMLLDVCVRPDYQGQGLGKQIIMRLIDEVKDKAYFSISLIADESNPNLISFYESLGFEKIPSAMELKKYQAR